MLNKYLSYSKEVSEALKANQPIVALESTIISHGMPYPQNVEMAKHTESIIREHGAVPATIAIIDGKIKIGLEEDELEMLGKNPNALKVSRRDFAYVVASKQVGATTVATTMMAAEMAGIKFFVTGGIGGVHRGYEEDMDVSADLEELAHTNVNVICAGAKSILDLPRTLEYLETHGVTVVGYQTDELPAFFTRESGHKLNLRLDTVEDIASVIKTKDELQIPSGVLITNPIPEEHQLEKDYINSVIEQATLDAKNQNISGKDVTPFMLAAIVEKTGGKSLEANIELVYNNAKVGAQLAVAHSKLN
ncbi:MAG: pseudouridine-5'-phosphate glycosidase [Erysipelothrix sp.]|nr:pseudouridine-5'-phosphate glycosidase [Erysipelothrix sp.]